jgi:hypothetical protein
MYVYLYKFIYAYVYIYINTSFDDNDDDDDDDCYKDENVRLIPSFMARVGTYMSIHIHARTHI